MKTENEIIKLSKEEFIVVLEALGYFVNKNGIIIDKNGKEQICEFTEEEVNINKISIMPGSIKIMNTTPVSISEYLYRYPND